MDQFGQREGARVCALLERQQRNFQLMGLKLCGNVLFLLNNREKRETVTGAAEMSRTDPGDVGFVGPAREATHGRARRAKNSKSGCSSTFLLDFDVE